MRKREWQNLSRLRGREVQQQFQMSEFRVWKCDRTDSCQTKPHDSSLWFVNTQGQIPDCPAESCLLSRIFHQDLLRNLGGNKVLGWMQGGVIFLTFKTASPNTGVTALTLNQYVLTQHQPASLSLCPFALPGPKDFGCLSHRTLLKPW